MLRVAALIVAAATVLPVGLQAQAEVDPVLSGTLFISGTPADSGLVILHRVTPEEAGRIDSTRVGAGGSFSFRLPNLPIPGTGEVFFRFGGIRRGGLFGCADRRPRPTRLRPRSPGLSRARGPSRGPRLPGIAPGGLDRGRAEGWEVTDVVEIQNPDSATFIAADGEAPVWRYPLPATALAPRVLQAGPVTGPTRFDGTTLVAGNPSCRRRTITWYSTTSNLWKWIFRSPARPGSSSSSFVSRPPAVRVEGLQQQPPEEIEVGSSFLRWAGEAIQDQTIAVRLGEEGGRAGAWLVLAAAMSLVLIGAASLLVRRRSYLAPAGAARRLRKDVLVDIARLDEEHGRVGPGDGRAGERYRRLRAKLLDELRRAEER